MKRMLRSAVICISCACMCACTSMQVVASGQDVKSYSRNLNKSGDSDELIYIQTQDGKRYEVRSKDFNADGVDVINADGKAQHISVEQIATIERNKTDSGKSLGLVAVVVAVFSVFIFVLAKKISQP